MRFTEVLGDKVNWVLPDFNEEYGEVEEATGKMGERYHAHFPSQEVWSAKARAGYRQTMQFDHDVENTGAFDGTDINDIPQEQRERVAKMFKAGDPIPMPVILKDDIGYILIGGNTRLSMAVALGVNPVAWVVDETKMNETGGVGKIVKGVNTTVDVGPGQDKIEQKKYFNKNFFKWMKKQPS
jgi:hypothetical protein|tara:strand:- start:409 stop:957 length:549 start_codon:yes stop_codon:yes gene_type:complete